MIRHPWKDSLLSDGWPSKDRKEIRRVAADPLSEVSWTPTGSSPFPTINSKPAYDHWSLSALASLINSPPPSPSSLPLEIASRLKEKEWPTPERVPEQQLACLESTYWLISDPESNDLHDEWRKGKGTWETVGRAMRFQPGLRRMAEDYAREMFGVGWGEEVPPVRLFTPARWVGGRQCRRLKKWGSGC